MEPERHKHYGRVNRRKELKRLAKLKARQAKGQAPEQPPPPPPPKETPAELSLRTQLHNTLTTPSTTTTTTTTTTTPATTSPPSHLALFYNLKLRRLPPCLFDYPALQDHLLHLNLSRNELKELPPTIGAFTALTHLDVSRNKLRRLPPSLQHLTHLQILNVSSNDFRSLHTLQLPVLAALERLQLLDLQHCPKIGRYGTNDLELLTAALGSNVQCEITQHTVPPESKLHAADRDASLLHSQIVPHATGALRRRLALVYGDTTNPELVEREEVIQRLIAGHERDNGYGGHGGPRAARYIEGKNKWWSHITIHWTILGDRCALLVTY